MISDILTRSSNGFGTSLVFLDCLTILLYSYRATLLFANHRSAQDSPGAPDINCLGWAIPRKTMKQSRLLSGLPPICSREKEREQNAMRMTSPQIFDGLIKGAIHGCIYAAYVPYRQYASSFAVDLGMHIEMDINVKRSHVHTANRLKHGV